MDLKQWLNQEEMHSWMNEYGEKRKREMNVGGISVVEWITLKHWLNMKIRNEE